jgi:uncharacterized phage-associated protein
MMQDYGYATRANDTVHVVVNSAAHHPLAAANLILDRAALHGLPITPLALQKLLYFVHGWRLASDGIPLLKGGFQAWKDGPVNRSVYEAFKEAGNKPIAFRAKVYRFPSGEETVAAEEFTAAEVKLVDDVLRGYGHLEPYELRRRTHLTGSPWFEVWHKKSVVLEMKISDEAIRAYFLTRGGELRD